LTAPDCAPVRGDPTGEVGAEVEEVRRGLPGRAGRVETVPRPLGLPGRGRSFDDRAKEVVALTGEGGGIPVY